jgi:anti-sigma regulatory factor (Ser/Thr protein kinase)
MPQESLPEKFQVNENDTTVSFHFPSDRTLLNAALGAAKASLRKWGIQQAEPILLSVRELLVNAIVHGNKNDATKQVVYQLRKSPDGGLTISVEDEGSGFDPELFDMDLHDHPKHLAKRGLVLIRALSETIIFDAAKGRIKTYLNPRQLEESLPWCRKEDPHSSWVRDFREFNKLLDYESRCAKRYDRPVSLVMATSGNGPIHYKDLLKGILRCSDRSIEVDEWVAVLMGETDREGALKAIARYKASYKNGIDLRYAIALSPQDGEKAEDLFSTARQRLSIAKQGETGAVVWKT